MGEAVEEKKLRNDMDINMHNKSGGIVEVKPKPNNGFTSKAIDWLEKLFVKLMHDSSQPLHYLTGNFAPVTDETPPCKDLPVHGHLPVCPNFFSILNFDYFCFSILAFNHQSIFNYCCN